METRRIGFQVDALLAPQQAITLYLAQAQLRAPAIERVSLVDANRRILALPIAADGPYPSAPRSAMDGFAVRSADLPGRLQIAGEIRMGHAREDILPPGAALRIPTGGIVPAGADAVVPIEDSVVEGESVSIDRVFPAGDSVTPAGSDMRAGEVMLQPGTRIRGPALGILATLGVWDVPVFRRPVLAVFSSGDELVPPWQTPRPGQIRDSNRYAVAGLLEALGASVRHYPTAPDVPEALEGQLRLALSECDGVVLTGGSSVGEKDLTPRIVARLGSPGVLVHGLKVKPGKPTLLASIDRKPVIGLPGNPASALTILEMVAAPIVSHLTGGACEIRDVEACLGEPVRKRPGWTWFVPARLDEAAVPVKAYPLELRSSSTSLLARASGLLILDESIEELAAGTSVRVRRFTGS